MLVERNVLIIIVCLTNFIKPITTECKCGEAPDSEPAFRIFGGEPAPSQKYPWIAYIQITKVLFCGGVVINDLYILTASHCSEKANGLNFTIYLHTINRTKMKGVRYQAVQIVKFHNILLPYQRSDIVLVKLNARIKFDLNTMPICLPNPGSQYTNLKVSILGWGMSEVKAASDSLRLASLTIMSDKYCKKSGIGKHYNPKMMLCAYAKGADACKGDSGGPLFYSGEVNSTAKYELVGLASSGIKCGAGAPGVYIKITRYLTWIMSNTKDANYCSY